MVNLGPVLDRLFGDLRFYAFLGERRFAEIKIEEKMIIIRITSPPVLAAAIINHMFRKKRFASHKLKNLKRIGYKVKIVYRKLEYELK